MFPLAPGNPHDFSRGSDVKPSVRPQPESTTVPVPVPVPTTVPAPLPLGFRLVLDGSVRTFDGGADGSTVLAGGHPGRLLRLTAAGGAALAELIEEGGWSTASRQVARRLVDAGMAHPRRPFRHAHTAGAHRVPDASTPDGTVPGVTIVVPVRDRAGLLDRCLASLGPDVLSVVVDDGSVDPTSVAEVCRRHRARLVTRAVSGGPGAARNDALASAHTPLVAFLDSDCVAAPGWLSDLTWLFDDPLIGAVAPRVRPARAGHGERHSFRDRFIAARSPLDMGEDESEVGPYRTVRYVPTAALVVRREALGEGFDVDLRYGEDVDLVWRLLDAGWRVRYRPDVEIDHAEPPSWPALLHRRFRYGTSAGPLDQRHPGRLSPVELRLWPAAAVLTLLAGRPRVAAVITTAMGIALARRVRPMGIPPSLAMRWGMQGTGWTLIGLGRAATMLAWPALALATGKGSHRVRRAVAALVLLPPVVEWHQRRPGIDPFRWTVASIADDVAYGAGVWVGCLRSGTFRPLVPVISKRLTAGGRGARSATSTGGAPGGPEHDEPGAG